MTDITDQPVGKKPRKVAKKRKVAKRAAPPAAARAEPKSEAYPGLTKTACATGCNINGCVLSEKPYCAHPCKGGLQAADLGNQGALGRMKAARRMLGIAEIDKQAD